jgi:hypothetical protein
LWVSRPNSKHDAYTIPDAGSLTTHRHKGTHILLLSYNYFAGASCCRAPLTWEGWPLPTGWWTCCRRSRCRRAITPHPLPPQPLLSPRSTPAPAPVPGPQPLPQPAALCTQPATFFPGAAPLQRPDQGSAALALRHTAPFLHHQPRHQLWHQPGRVPRRSGRRVPAEAAERCRVSGVGGGVQGGVHGLRGAACATGTRKHASGGSVG